MKKFRRKKLAFALACASIFGCKTQAAQNIKTEQSLAAVGGAATKNSNKGFINLVKNHKLGVGIGGALIAVTAITLAILGVKYLGKKENGGDPNKKGNNPIKDKNIIDQKDLGTKDNDSDPNKKQDIQNIKEVNDNSDGNQIIENKNNGDEGGNSKKDLKIENKIKIEEKIQPPNKKGLEEQNKSNFQLINDAIINKKFTAEADNEQKDLIIKALKYFAETLNGKSVVEVLKLDILDKFLDANYDDYFKHNDTIQAIARNFGSPIQELLDIFSDRSKISVTNQLISRCNGSNSYIGFELDLNNDAKVTLRSKIADRVVEIKYDSIPKGQYNSRSHINFNISHDLLNKN